MEESNMIKDNEETQNAEIIKVHEITVLILQFSAIFKKRTESIEKAEILLNKYSSKQEIDIVLLPENAFQGCAFTSKEDIDPYLELNNSGPTFDWCQLQAKKLGSYICCGYPEKVIDNIEGEETISERYISCMIVAPSGELFYNYRKHFLYPEIDIKWADEGPSFKTIHLPIRSGRILKTGISICMDIEPYTKTGDPKIELGNYFHKQHVELVIFLANWTNKGLNEQYWINRLFPLTKEGGGQENCVFLACNRVGVENKIQYMGDSCVVRLNPNVHIIQKLDQYEEASIFANFYI